MTQRLRRAAWSTVGLIVATGLGWAWLGTYGDDIQAGPRAIPALGIAALGCLCLAIGLQVLRTALLLGHPVRGLTRPLLLAHGMNVWLPSMMGDFFEVWAVSRIARRSVRGTLVLLGHRFLGTVAALGILSAVAIGPTYPSLSVGIGTAAVLGYIAMDGTIHTWARWLRVPETSTGSLPAPLGPTKTLGHLGLAVVQHGVEAIGIFLLGISLGAAISPAGAAGMVSIIEAVTYLPIPLGGAGANHWGASTVLEWIDPGRHMAMLVLAAHALHVGLGAACIGLASILPRDEKGHSRP